MVVQQKTPGGASVVLWAIFEYKVYESWEQFGVFPIFLNC